MQEINGVSWYLETQTFVTEIDGQAYISFVTDHFGDFAVTQWSNGYIGTFKINNDDASTDTWVVTLNHFYNSTCHWMRFSNDTITRSDWVWYTTTYPWILSGNSNIQTVYAQFDVNNSGIPSITANDSIIFHIIDTTYYYYSFG